MSDAVSRVIANSIPVTETGCWLWLGSLSPSGYGQGNPERKTVRIHRWLYQKLFGSIGDLTIDHKCRVRCCINPAHMEPVTAGENSLRGFGPTAMNKRKTHCDNGHEFDRLIKRKDGSTSRRCLTCHNERSKLSHRRIRNENSNV